MSDQDKPSWILALEWIAVCVLVFLSGLFSGLNLGLMSLDPSGLTIVQSGGIEPNATYARRIFPLRKHGNWLLCTLLLGNVAVNAALPIVLADKAGGPLGFVISTAVITLFGEIVPQALCSRYALAVGNATRPMVWVLMFVIGPISWPISLVLDWVLDEELPTIYSNKGLQKLIEIHELANESNVTKLTAKMLKGALGLDDTLVNDRMTNWSDVFYLDESTILNFDTLSQIFKKGHSRVPIIHKHIIQDKFKLIGILYVKDLILIDPDDEIPVTKIMNAFDYPVPKLIYKNSSLSEALYVFIKYQTHIAVVSHEDVYMIKSESLIRVEDNILKSIPQDNMDTNDGGGTKITKTTSIENIGSSSDSEDIKYDFNFNNKKSDKVTDYTTKEYHSYAGIITLEDVIERILQTELIDEHDNYEDNEKTKKTTRLHRINWNILSMFDHRSKELMQLDVSEIQAIYSYFVQTIPAFKPRKNNFTRKSIYNLISKSKVTRVIVSKATNTDDDIYDGGLTLYEKNKTTKYFTLILHGKCEIFSGKQRFRIEKTRWSVLCPDALDVVEQNYRQNKVFFDYVCDFDARVIEDSRILRIEFDEYRGCLAGKFDYEPPLMLRNVSKHNDDIKHDIDVHSNNNNNNNDNDGNNKLNIPNGNSYQNNTSKNNGDTHVGYTAVRQSESVSIIDPNDNTQ